MSNTKWDCKFLPKLEEASKSRMLYKDIGLIFGVTGATARNWIERYLPEEFARRLEERKKWRREYLPKLRQMFDNKASFEEMGEALDVNSTTARRWVLRYLGQEAFDQVPRRGWKHSEEEKEEAREMRRNGALLKDIEERFGVSKSTAQGWCKGIPRPSRESVERYVVGPDPDTVGPTHKELQAIEEGSAMGLMGIYT